MNQDVKELIDRWPLIKEFNLPPESNVVVVGAYKGLAMEALDELYHPAQVIGYEPQIWAANETFARVEGRDNCAIIPFALWAGTPPVGKIPMGEWHTDACSFVNVGPGSREQGFGSAIDANLALATLGVDKIDLMVMNIESYEYQLIPYLRSKKWLEKIDRLAVQWHLGLGEDPKTLNDVDKYVFDLYDKDHFVTAIDERPAWTYHTKGV